MSTKPKETKLPPGKACRDCRYFAQCAFLVQKKPEATECDFGPSRSRELYRNEAWT